MKAHSDVKAKSSSIHVSCPEQARMQHQLDMQHVQQSHKGSGDVCIVNVDPEKESVCVRAGHKAEPNAGAP